MGARTGVTNGKLAVSIDEKIRMVEEMAHLLMRISIPGKCWYPRECCGDFNLQYSPWNIPAGHFSDACHKSRRCNSHLPCLVASMRSVQAQEPRWAFNRRIGSLFFLKVHYQYIVFTGREGRHWCCNLCCIESRLARPDPFYRYWSCEFT